MSVRLRLLFGWGLFLVAAVVAGLAVHRLYQRAQAEIAGQSERALQQARQAAEELVRARTGEARLAIMRELAGFHEDGLATTLRRWNAANGHVKATFLWDAKRGLVPDVENATAGTAMDLPALWREFREWRTAHPDAFQREPMRIGELTVLATRTLDNPSLPAAALRYQAENLDLLRDSGTKIDPWAGWAASDVAGAPWIFWYQAGPETPVRGCLVNTETLVAALRTELKDSEAARLSLVPTTQKLPANAPRLPGLPGYRLVVEPGEIFRQKEADARFDALIAALLFGLFLLGTAALAWHTRRAAREAARKITFATQVSHELRTPLTSIRMFADMLAAPGLPEEKRLRFANTIGTESARLGGLIERLLAFNTLEKGTARVQVETFDVLPLLREVIEETASALQAAGLTASLPIETTPVLGHTDRSILKQALLNLVDNACKYATGGTRLDFTVRIAEQDVTVRVADDGPGIPAAIQGRLFEPFVQGGSTLTSKSPGVGLGLSLSRGLLRRAGAELVRMPAERGACFEIRVPAGSAFLVS